MRSWLIAVAVIHTAFMICELFPWSRPVLLRIASKKEPRVEPFTPLQQKMVATIVHNAGIYNAVLAGGLFWAAATGNPDVARVLLVGAAVAGIFGTITLKSPLTAVQAVAGILVFTMV